jgi:hypothetical protein
VTNLKESMVLPLIISGTTLVFVESIGVSTPFTFAVFFPIQSSMVVLPKVTVTFCSLVSQPTVPTKASMIALIGRSVLLFFITGGSQVCLFYHLL